MRWLSRSIDALQDEVFSKRCASRDEPDFDVVVVGSGYGGAVAAARFARAGFTVCILERGREYVPGEFPNQIGDLAGHVRFRRADWGNQVANPLGLFDVNLGPDVATLTGNALGGGSQINANVGIRADVKVFAQDTWPFEFRSDPNCLAGYYAEAERCLGIRPYPRKDLPRLARLAELAGMFDASVRGEDWDDLGEPEVRCAPAPLAVTFADGLNAFGVAQRRCIECGDCVTGCNHWAKNTLTMNYLPDAVAHHARAYTGATVVAVDPRKLWKRVYLRRSEDVLRYRNDPTAGTITDAPAPADVEQLPYLKARVVVLAAGAVGSTEVLLRSRDLLDLKLSPVLGTGFSGNGDTLGFSTLQDQPVNGVGLGPQPPNAARPVGPTITGVIDARDRVPLDKALLFEDGAVPGAIAHLWQEMLALGATLGQLDRWTVANENNDRAGLHAAFRTHTQTLLMMGHDDAGGVVRLRDGHPVIRWPGAADQACARRAHDLAKLGERLGGIYLRNALTNPLPEAMQSILSGPEIRGVALTVHPLGGCRMGDSIETGVVSHRGEVFTSEAAGTYEDFFVWDGSIMPGSLGVNPFLTITALAERAADLVISEKLRQRQEASAAAPEPGDAEQPPPVVPAAPPELTPKELQAVLPTVPLVPPIGARSTQTGFVWRESLRGRLAGINGKDRHAELALCLDIPDVTALVADPNHRVEHVTGTLRIGGRKIARAIRTYRVVSGQIDLMVPAPRNPLWRWLTGPYRYLRTIGVWIVKRRTEWWESIRKFFTTFPGGIGGWRVFVNFLKLVKHASDVREMRYRLVLKPDPPWPGDVAEHCVLEGRKYFAFRLGGNLWTDLTELEIHGGPWQGRLQLSLREMADQNRPGLAGSADLLEGMTRVLSLPAFLLRTMLPMYLWDLRAPSLPSSARRLELLPEEIDGLVADGGDNFTRSGAPLLMERHRFVVPARLDEGAFPRTIPLLLTRYQSGETASKPESAKQTVILLHGFAQSSLAIAVPTMKVNLVQYLCAHGFDVWLLDYRTSTALASAYESHNLDHCAGIDVPAAVRFVRKRTGREAVYGEASRLHLVGHCMGAAVSGMALLGGHLVDDQARAGDTRLIDKLVLMQVPPVIVGTAYSQMRREVAALIRDTVGVSGIPLNASDGDAAVWAVLDRVFATYPDPGHGIDERCPGEKTLVAIERDTATCKRVSAIIGRLYRHENINRATHENLDRYFGFGNVDIFTQITKFFANEKYVDVHGRKAYVTEERIRKYGNLDTLFLHGAENFVFDPLSAELSWQRFADIHEPGRFRYEKIEGFAHFDCLVGDDDRELEACSPDEPDKEWLDRRRAWKKVFPKIADHLRGTAAEQPVLEHKKRKERCLLPELGPFLGHVRIASPGVALRVWAKPEATASIQTPTHVLWVVLRRTDGTPIAGAQQRVNALTHHGPGTFGEAHVWFDIVLDQMDDYEIRVVFMHGEQEPAPPPTMEQVAQRIERHAGYLEKFRCERQAEIKPRSSLLFRQVKDLSRATILVSAAQLRAACAAAYVPTRFFLGSCRYPGTMLDRDRSDAAFVRMCECLAPEGADGATGRPVASLLLLAGDQIYADARAGLFDLQSDLERYPSSYARAWESRHFSSLLRRIPTAMILDDHEICNDYSIDAAGRGVENRATVVRRAQYGQGFYAAYQEALGPDGPAGALRAMTHGGYPFVLFDSRTGRMRGDPLSPFPAQAARATTLGDVNQLVRWLADQQQRHADTPKFVVTGSVVFPGFVEADGDECADPMPGGRAAARIDNWQGFADDRNALLCGIAAHDVANVVFLSGDYHCGVAASMELSGSRNGRRLKAASIAAPALYAPLPFVNTRPHELIDHGVIRAAPDVCATYVREACFADAGFAELVVARSGGGWELRVTMAGATDAADPAQAVTIRLP